MNSAPPRIHPKVSGVTLVRNGQLFDYPFLESIRSMLPWVDELIINVDPGEDQTLLAIETLCASPEAQGKAKILHSHWEIDNPEKKRGGKILSEQTNLAIAQASHPWCLYLQADEILHEVDREAFFLALSAANSHPEVEGLLFDYTHFYGSYDVIQKSRSAYRREVRCIRKSSGAQSVGDAQSFRKPDGSKLQVISSGTRIFHYGWVKPPEKMKEKTYFLDQLYHGSPTEQQARTRTPHTGNNYRYKRIWGLRPFQGSHPKVMQERVQAKNWTWDYRHLPLEWNFSDASKIALDLLEDLTGKRFFEYRSYRLIHL